MKSLLHFCKFMLYQQEPDTQVTERELQVLLRHSRAAEVIVEIGCYEGRTAATLGQNTSGKVYTVDHFPRGRLGICYSEWIARIHCRRRGLTNVRFLKGLSSQVALRFDQEIDLVFLDADHSYQGVKSDWEAWFPKVRAGGIVALHDCKQAPNSPRYLGSMEFYDRDIPQIPEIREVDAVDSLAVFRVNR